MAEIQYLGENIIAGTFGKFFIYLSLIAGLLSLLYYIKVIRTPKGEKYKSIRFGRIFYYIQTVSILLTGLILFYLILGHHFEYSYIFQHSSKLMPGKYIISSFWAGQEGSFLLWAILIALYGIGSMHTSGRLESGVMSVVTLSNFFLMTMLLGINVFGINLGSNPFELLREVSVNQGNDFFSNPNYLNFITDGNGLNPLLENPWMVIHPPVLFMGYAAALFPFAYAFASLIDNDKRYWIKLALPWVTLSIGLLGAGLLLGGAWAYQSLTFGGFWAWDPVENASLVPWLVLVAALHYLLLSYKRDRYYWGSYIFSFLGFLTVVYASYLTRSGVLGETSVHAFGDNGLTVQLVAFMLVFTILPVWMLYKRRKSIPTNDLPASMDREFMMLYGSVVLLLSAFQIISTTSLPVVNKIIGTNLTLSSNVVGFYNSWQMPFAMMAALLLGFVHYLSYERNDKKVFWKNILIPVSLSAILSVAAFFIDTDMLPVHSIFLFMVLFAIFSSIAYLFRFIRKHHNLQAGLTHLGFSIFLFGVLITFSNTITFSSQSASGAQGSNIMLFKGQARQVGNQVLKYSSNREERDEIFYQIDFLEQVNGQEKVKYSVYPSVKYNDRMGNVHNPDTRNMLKGDVFMYLTFAEDRSKRAADGYSVSQTYDISVKDSKPIDGKEIILDSLSFDLLDASGQNIAVTANLRAVDSLNGSVSVPLKYIVRGNIAESEVVQIPGSDARLRFEGITEMAKTIQIALLEKQPEFIVLKVMFFPWIMVLWAGSIIMFIGLTISVYKRAIKANKEG